MFKKVLFLFCISIVLIALPFYSVDALELDESTRTVQLEQDGQIVILTPDQVKRGKRLFNNTCAQCHNGGITKTNPNIGLDPETRSTLFYLERYRKIDFWSL